MRVEESRTQEFILASGWKRCPNVDCGARVERNGGCNHMECLCGTHFCYVCNSVLDPLRPHTHYAVSTSPVYEVDYYGCPHARSV